MGGSYPAPCIKLNQSPLPSFIRHHTMTYRNGHYVPEALMSLSRPRGPNSRTCHQLNSDDKKHMIEQ